MVVLPPEVADKNTRRNSCQPHQSSETRCIVFAKPHATTEKKFVQIGVFAWRQRVAETLRPEKFKRAAYYAARVAILQGPGVCQVAHRRSNRRRHLQRFCSFPRCDLVRAEF